MSTVEAIFWIAFCVVSLVADLSLAFGWFKKERKGGE